MNRETKFSIKAVFDGKQADKGLKELNKGLNELLKNDKMMSTELNKNNTQIRNSLNKKLDVFRKNTKAIITNQRSFNRQYLTGVNNTIKANNKLITNFNKMTREINKANQKMAKDNAKAMVKMSSSNNKVIQGNNKIEQSYRKRTNEIGKLNTSLANKSKNSLNKIQSINKRMETSAEKVYNKEKIAIEKRIALQEELKNKIQATNSVSTKPTHVPQSVSNAGMVKTPESRFNGLGAVAGSLIAVAPIISTLKGITEIGMEFDEQMSSVTSKVSGTNEEVKKLRETAIKLGGDTSKSATEVAVAMDRLAAKGYTINQIIEMMPGAIYASEASGEDLAQTVDLIASSINAFGLEAKESVHLSDVFSKASIVTSSNLTVLQNAFRVLGPTASMLKIPIEEVTASIGLLADKGITGETAGTNLATSLSSILTPAGEDAKRTLRDLGIETVDSQGNFVGLNQVVDNFNNSMKGMTKTQKLAAVTTVVGKESAKTFLSLLESGGPKIREFTKALEESDGSSLLVAQKRMNNLAGDVERLRGTIESFKLNLFEENVNSPLRKVVQTMDSLIDTFSHLPKGMQNFIMYGGMVVSAVVPIVTVLGLLVASSMKVAEGYSKMTEKMNKNTLASKANLLANLQSLSLAKELGGGVPTNSTNKKSNNKGNKKGNILKQNSEVAQIGFASTIVGTITNTITGSFKKSLSLLGKRDKKGNSRFSGVSNVVSTSIAFLLNNVVTGTLLGSFNKSLKLIGKKDKGGNSKFSGVSNSVSSSIAFLMNGVVVGTLSGALNKVLGLLGKGKGLGAKSKLFGVGVMSAVGSGLSVGLRGMFGKILGLASTLSGGLITLLGGPVTATVAGIIALGTALTVGYVKSEAVRGAVLYLSDALARVPKMLQGVWLGIKGIFVGIGDLISSIPGLKGVGGSVSNFARDSGIGDYFSKLHQVLVNRAREEDKKSFNNKNILEKLRLGLSGKIPKQSIKTDNIAEKINKALNSKVADNSGKGSAYLGVEDDIQKEREKALKTQQKEQDKLNKQEIAERKRQQKEQDRIRKIQEKQQRDSERQQQKALKDRQRALEKQKKQEDAQRKKELKAKNKKPKVNKKVSENKLKTPKVISGSGNDLNNLLKQIFGIDIVDYSKDSSINKSESVGLNKSFNQIQSLGFRKMLSSSKVNIDDKLSEVLDVLYVNNSKNKVGKEIEKFSILEDALNRNGKLTRTQVDIIGRQNYSDIQRFIKNTNIKNLSLVDKVEVITSILKKNNNGKMLADALKGKHVEGEADKSSLKGETLKDLGFSEKVSNALKGIYGVDLVQYANADTTSVETSYELKNLIKYLKSREGKQEFKGINGGNKTLETVKKLLSLVGDVTSNSPIKQISGNALDMVRPLSKNADIKYLDALSNKNKDNEVLKELSRYMKENRPKKTSEAFILKALGDVLNNTEVGNALKDESYGTITTFKKDEEDKKELDNSIFSLDRGDFSKSVSEGVGSGLDGGVDTLSLGVSKGLGNTGLNNLSGNIKTGLGDMAVDVVGGFDSSLANNLGGDFTDELDGVFSNTLGDTLGDFGVDNLVGVDDFNGALKGIDKLGKGVNTLGNGIDSVDTGIGSLDTGIGNIDTGIGSIDTGISALDGGLANNTKATDKTNSILDKMLKSGKKSNKQTSKERIKQDAKDMLSVFQIGMTGFLNGKSFLSGIVGSGKGKGKGKGSPFNKMGNKVGGFMSSPSITNNPSAKILQFVRGESPLNKLFGWMTGNKTASAAEIKGNKKSNKKGNKVSKPIKIPVVNINSKSVGDSLIKLGSAKLNIKAMLTGAFGGSLITNVGKGLMSRAGDISRSVGKVFSGVRNTYNSTVGFMGKKYDEFKGIISGTWEGLKSKLFLSTGLILKKYGEFKQGLSLVSGFMKGKVMGTAETISRKYSEIKATITTSFYMFRKIMWDTGANMWKGVQVGVKGVYDTLNSFGKNISKFTKSIGKTFNNVKEGAFSLVENVGKTIKNIIGGAFDGVKGLANDAISLLNSVTEKLGGDGKIPKFKISKHSRGTDYHEGGLMVVGDRGPGNDGSNKRELVIFPNGNTFLSPNKDTLLNAPRGTQVLNAKMTRDLIGVRKYSKGIGSMNKSVITNVAMKDVLDDAMSRLISIQSSGNKGSTENTKEIMSEVIKVIDVNNKEIVKAIYEIFKNGVDVDFDAGKFYSKTSSKLMKQITKHQKNKNF